MVTRRAALFLVALACAQAAPQRIISTAPSITELLYALGLGDRVVAVTKYCRYPIEAQAKPKIGDYTSPNLELMASLRPDLVIIQNNPVRLKERLEAMKLKVLEIRQDDLASLLRSFREVAAAAAVPERGEKLARSVQDELAAVRMKSAKLPRVRTMFVVGRSPNRLDGLIVAARASYINEAIAAAGGDNVFGDAQGAYPSVSLEEVIARNPEVIIDMGDMADSNITQAQMQATISLWSRMSNLAAVKKGRVYPVASDIYVVPGPRLVDAARAFLAMLHPEAK